MNVDPKNTAIIFEFKNGETAQIRIEPELVEYVAAVKMALSVFGGKVLGVRCYVKNR